MYTFSRARHSAGALATAAALAAGILIGAGGSPATAAPAPNGSVTSDATAGMRFTGLAGPNVVTVVMTGTQFLVSDIAPITVGPGCTPIPMGGGHFGAACLAPTFTNGQLRRFRVDTGSGNDVITNSSKASMTASGGDGDDVLNGGLPGDILIDSRGNDVLRGNGGDDSLDTTGGDDATKDVLDGGPGNDDLQAGPSADQLLGGDGDDTIRGGFGADLIDAGAGGADAVVYLENGRPDTRNVVSLDNQANDGKNIGGVSEGDNVLASAEQVFGGHGPDILIGNSNRNVLDGNEGDDVLIGNGGADVLRGRGGNDRLHSNTAIDLNVADGAIDTLDGSVGTDVCLIPFNEADVTISCEIIDVG
jgi:Ca2+-binding RTX toxin-like protein